MIETQLAPDTAHGGRLGTSITLRVSVAGLIAVQANVDVDLSSSAMRPVIERYEVDQATLERSWSEMADVWEDAPARGGQVEPMTPAQITRMRRLYGEWAETLRALPFDSFDQASRIDYLLLNNRLRYEISRLDAIERRLAAIRPIVAFGDVVLDLDAAGGWSRQRRRLPPEASASC